jgi:hypothetical protein
MHPAELGMGAAWGRGEHSTSWHVGVCPCV